MFSDEFISITVTKVQGKKSRRKAAIRVRLCISSIVFLFVPCAKKCREREDAISDESNRRTWAVSSVFVRNSTACWVTSHGNDVRSNITVFIE